MNLISDRDLGFQAVLIKSGFFFGLVSLDELIHAPFLIKRFFEEEGVIFDPRQSLGRENDEEEQKFHGSYPFNTDCFGVSSLRG